MNTFINNEKNVLIVEGGPGTGKSVIAINLLKQFLSRGLNTFYVTKNSVPREVFKSKLKIDRLSELNNLFKGSGCFYDSKANSFDVLIVNKSRLVAGYCWDWISEGKNETDVYDIVIPEYNFKMSWNLKNSSTWAIDKNSVNEVGCIHTCQGLEFDYVGVIIGEDLRFENGRIISDYTKRASTDQSLKGIKKITKEKGEEYSYKVADLIIKNTYKTLMTRGMKGCFVYCTDKALNNYFKEHIFKNENQL